MVELNDLQRQVIKFRDEREWQQFHNPKDLAISLVLEATEFLEHFQWKNEVEVKQHLKDKKADVMEELADVLYWVLLIAHDLDIQLDKALIKKLAKNQKKYPVEKARGKHNKYNEL